MRLAQVAVSLSVALLLGCGGGTTDPGSTPPPAPPPPPAAPNTVAVSSNQFSPSTLSVAKGTTVTWNFQGGPHNVTFEDNLTSGDKSSGSYDRTFSAAGTVRYRCTIHSSDFSAGMVGSVVVQ